MGCVHFGSQADYLVAYPVVELCTVFFFQAEDGIRDGHVTGVQTCALPITDGGGSVLMYQVENELIAEDEERSAFLRGLADHVRSTGITVPLFHNDYGLGGRFKDVEAHHLDFYAYDHYPLGFNAGGARAPIGDSEQAYRAISPDTPQFITESQGGAFTPWGASFTSDQAYEFTDPAFTRQWGVRNLANGVTAFNYYMAFGGTNWGYTGSPSSGDRKSTR